MYQSFNPKQVYHFEQLEQDLTILSDHMNHLCELRIIGYSVEGRPIYAFKIGSGEKRVCITGAHHAREWLTTNLIVDFIYHLLFDQTWAWLTIREDWLRAITFWFVPMVNPDGVKLVQQGSVGLVNQKNLLTWNRESTDFERWKANASGVDLNRQYPEGWEIIQNDPGYPSESHYKGENPLSEPEAQALHDFVSTHKMDCALAYHSSGEEIFWRYLLEQSVYQQFQPLANELAQVTGYQLIDPGENPSGGGFIDWFLMTFKKPGFTIEIAPSVGPKPVPLSMYNQVFQSNELVLYVIADFLINK
ncbi:g-D-glutamyl-meso-diaminopimelate peptidase [Amphibacillus marinus]|uniref:G-D-glutamyl-meso-diaminopimelate peptidase n=1 Tax=Amphibacillus marinus TaxID=872970 RepID=A0A1H8RXI3_9BACI|nr:M14 family zinc carboxypeptidase [Amphibacillus marinus]SEO70643.1 g-D-glutamyl-meso-diaminopimelate peptidase [Amphibacillus marinus]